MTASHTLAAARRPFTLSHVRSPFPRGKGLVVRFLILAHPRPDNRCHLSSLILWTLSSTLPLARVRIEADGVEVVLMESEMVVAALVVLSVLSIAGILIVIGKLRSLPASDSSRSCPSASIQSLEISTKN